MARRSTQTDKILIDPAFSIPEGAEESFVYTREPDEVEGIESRENSEYFDAFEADDFEGVEVAPGVEIFDEWDLEIPEDFNIISQTIRRAPGGQNVVDIVIEVEDIAGAEHYEIQVTRI